jgi:hypothetical protein
VPDSGLRLKAKVRLWNWRLLAIVAQVTDIQKPSGKHQQNHSLDSLLSTTADYSNLQMFS